MNGHTKGPWTMHAIDRLEMVYIIGPEPQNKFIAHMDEEFTSKDEQWANAAFIVRACNAHDELLEACKMASYEVESRIGSMAWAQNLVKYLDAAIAKAARGRLTIGGDDRETKT